MTFPVSFDALAIEQPGAAVAHRNAFQLPTPCVLGFDFAGEVVRVEGCLPRKPAPSASLF